MEYKIAQRLQEYQRTPNLTGIPMQMRLNAERNSGLSFHDVCVHYHSDKPAQIQALAYTQGNDIYIAPGQERHLPHELGHVAQQKRGLVRPTSWLNGMAINEDSGLEQMAEQGSFPQQFGNAEQSGVIQRFKVLDKIWDTSWGTAWFKPNIIKRLSPATCERFIQILTKRVNQLENKDLIKILNADINLFKDRLTAVTAPIPVSGSQSNPPAPQEQLSSNLTVQDKSGGQLGVEISKVIWDTEWSPEVKNSHIQGASRETFDKITKALILGINEVKDHSLSKEEKREQNKKLREELIFIVDQYNRLSSSREVESRPHIDLPQAKTVRGAPSRLVMGETSSGEGTEKGYNLDVYYDVCKLLKIEQYAPNTAISAMSCSTRYIEDPIEILRNGYISTRIAYPFNINKIIIKGRRARKLSEDDISDAEVGAASVEGKAGVEVAKDVCNSLLQKDELRHVYRLCPIEGGNMLTGSDFIIVGKDSFYATMDLFDINEDEAKELIAGDFGVLPERVFPVEQPGAYHLDLGMLLLDNHTVLLRAMDKSHPSIQKAAKDLLDSGFGVIFENGCAIGRDYNFINGEFLKIGDEVIFLTNAPNVDNTLEQAKEGFIKILRRYGVKDVYFIRGSLDKNGTAGFGCKAKGVPDELIPKQSKP